jgi:formylglycine-generating enzyme
MKPIPACGLALLAAAAGCSKKTGPAGGLLVQISTDGTFHDPLTKLHIEIGPVGDAAAYDTADYAIPVQARLPASLGVQSNGDPASSVVIDVSVWSGAAPLDVRRYEIDGVPTSTVEEVDVVLSAHCTPRVVDLRGVAESSCGPWRTCDPKTGGCVSDVYGATDAGESDAADAAEGGLDADASDGSEADGDAGDGAADGGCSPDAGPACDGNTPERCVSGRWVDDPEPCLGGLQCSQGACRAVASSCSHGVATWTCDSLEVPGGTFARGYDGVGFTDASAQATVNAFRLDAYEVTVPRLTAFQNAIALGEGLPEAGTGKHDHLNGGLGLVVGAADGGPIYESGWDPAWAQTIATNPTDWATNLGCTPVAFDTDLEMGPYPANCVTWYEAYAFCIWDGGFLPTEAEWNYAAAGGSAQREYPWGSQDPGDGPEYAIWGCYYNASGICTESDHNLALIGHVSAGAGLWGQWDLAGNMAEWTLDAYQPSYPMPCADCAARPGSGTNVLRGGSFNQDERYLLNATRVAADPSTRDVNIGIRCARSP